MKEETRNFIEKSKKAIRAAEIMLREDQYDVSVSRAYYSMLYTAKALLVEEDFRFKKHTAVHSAYSRHFSKTGLLDKKFHRQMLNAFDQRLEADYDDIPSISVEEVHAIIKQAKEFLAAAQKFLSKN